MRRTKRLGHLFEYMSSHHDLAPTSVLRDFGLSPMGIAQLVEDGVLERIVRGLYRRAGSRSTLQDIAAAVLRHSNGVASHSSALYVHGFDIAAPSRPHITLPPGSTSATSLGTLHRSPMEAVDRTRRRRIPVTTTARSIVDASEVLTVDALAAVVNEGVTRRWVTIPGIVDAASRVEVAPGRIGSGRLRRVLATWTDSLLPDSVAEAAAIRRIRTFGLPVPVTQHEILDASGAFVARVDLAWPEQRVAREYQSIEWHRPDRIEPDEERLQRLEALGWDIEPLFRYQLLPAEVRWLRELESQLRRNETRAS